MTEHAAEIVIELPDEDHTERLGKTLANHIAAPLIVYLHGELGAGKTRLARAILHGLGHQGNVKSPTYTLVEPYELDDFTLYHFDLYRLADPLELDYLGIRDYFTKQTVALIEWPEKGKGVVNPADIEIEMHYLDEGRKCILRAKTKPGENCLTNLKQSL